MVNRLMRKSLFVIADIVGIFLVTLLIFYESNSHLDQIVNDISFIISACIAVIVCVFSFYIFNLYNSLWAYASMHELRNAVLAVALSNAILVIISLAARSGLQPITHFMFLILSANYIVISRWSYRFARYLLKKHVSGGVSEAFKYIMIVGAGSSGAMILKEYIRFPELGKPIVFIDDDPKKIGQFLMGIPIIGGSDKIVETCKKKMISEIVLAIPSASKRQTRDIIDICKTTKCKLKIIPSVGDLLNGKVTINNIRDVQIEDLLGREPVKMGNCDVVSYITGKVVMVTGGGGSIGSELCRQIVAYSPSRIIVVDIYENTVFDLQQELMYKYPDIRMEFIIANICDTSMMIEIFGKYKPDVVFHAAAHKHVPLMESNLEEAIKNNVYGTLSLVKASHLSGVGKFIMISSDKAVNPTSIMGTSKRLAEMIVQSFAPVSKTEFVSVRFGNVLGSNGSVIPLFKKQISEGGPVRVTHADVVRYFMTIPEAVELLLHTGALAKGGEVFILDMGEPVRIIDLARDLIRLSGFEPDVDIKIEITGLRPGEKLYEDLLRAEETTTTTKFEKIFVCHPKMMVHHELLKKLDSLLEMICRNDPRETVIDSIRELVPTYKTSEEHCKDVLDNS